MGEGVAGGELATNPLLVDTYKDELIDGEEVNEHKTSALESATDKDGLTESAE